MEKKRNITRYEKHDKNPFVEKAIKEINGNLIKKYRTSNKYDERAVLQAFDPRTGEILGHTTFIRQIEVDEEKFTKMYLSNFHSFWDLGKQAIKVFGYIMTRLIPKQDMFIFLLKECMEYTGYATHKPIYQGLSDLLKAEIIARGPADNLYFINPLVAFNGDRVTFAKSYVKKRKLKEDPAQLNVFSKAETKDYDTLEGN